MTKDMTSRSDLDALERVLDTFGADPARWPAADRDGLKALLARDEAAARLHAEARALDLILAKGDAAAGAPARRRRPAGDMLAARIVAAAIAEGVPHPASGHAGIEVETSPRRGDGVIVAWPGGRAARTATAKPSRWARVTGGWGMGAMMAASLAAGLLIGALDMTPSFVGRIASGLDAQSETVRTLAGLQGDALSVLLEEDQL